MTNFEWLKNLSMEQMASFLAHERYRLVKPVFEKSGYGITEDLVYVILLKWLNDEMGEE